MLSTEHEYVRSEPERWHNHELERSILGGLILDPRLVSAAQTIIAARDFHSSGHGVVFEALSRIVSRGELVDVHTLAAEVKSLSKLNAIGGLGYIVGDTVDSAERALASSLAAMRDGTPTTASVPVWCEMLADLTRVRELDADLTRAVRAVRSEPAAEAYAHLCEMASQALTKGRKASGAMSMYDAMSEAYEAVAATVGGPSVSHPLGLSCLDAPDALGGIRREQLLVFSAAPGGGKTVFGTNAAVAAAQYSGKRGRIYQCEMDPAELALRFACSVANRSGGPRDRLIGPALVEGHGLLQHEVDRYVAAVSEVSAWPVDIVDAAGWTIEQIAADVASASAEQGGLALVVIDYLGEVATSHGMERSDLRERYGHIARMAKRISRKSKVGVVLLAQMTRGGNVSDDPVMQDILGGSGIESVADVVVLGWLTDAGQQPLANRSMNLKVAKNRRGAMPRKQIVFEAANGRYVTEDEHRAWGASRTSAVVAPKSHYEPEAIDEEDF